MAEKQATFFPSGGLDANKKYGFVKGVAVQNLTYEEKMFLNNNPSVVVFHGFGEFRVQPKESLDVLFVGEGFSETSNAEVWGRLCEALVPGGQLRVKFPQGVTSHEDVSSRLLLGGFINSVVTPTLVAVAEKPTWKPTAALPLKKKNKANAWKVETKSEEVVDEDALLEENDCGGTISGSVLDGISVTKKACKNCSCGLADAEQASVKIDLADSSATEEKTSGCGNCAKGDAFRCGGCPYLGLPAFTPGTKPQIVTKADGTKSLMIDTSSDI